MKDSDIQLIKERRKRQLLIMSVSTVVATLLLSYGLFLFLGKGYAFNVMPEDAKPPRYSIQSGGGFFLGSKFYTFSAATDIKVDAPKYQPQTVTITQDSPASIDVTLVPMPAQVVLTTDPAIEEASWRIDGDQVHVGPILETRLAPGEYNVSVSSPFHQPAALSLALEKADEVSQSLVMTQITGTLSIASTPLGAQVTIDGEALGVTPVSVQSQGGYHDISLQHPGYEPVNDRLALSHTEPNPSRDYKLKPLQATLVVNAQPAGGALLVNGAPQTSPVSLDANRNHVVSYEKAGFLPFQQTVNIAAGGRKDLNIALKMATGKVTFVSSEPATVSVGGKNLGTSPVSLELQTLKQQVTFSKPGYRAVTKTFTPALNRSLSVNAEMLTEFAARRKEGRPLFVETLGLDMVLVEPEPFTIGSAPNVPRRKRNEHQIKVEYSRNFWLSSTEVTEAQFNRFKGQGGGGKLPVTNVTWLEAAAFCNWLSEQEGLKPFYDLRSGRFDKTSAGYRLPTEAEWEYAASKFMQYTSFKYFWGLPDRIPSKQGNFADKSLKGKQTFVLANYEDGHAGKAPVGSFKKRSGLFDFAGNVSEWVHDQYDVVPPDLTRTYTDYFGPSTGSGHVVKGGSFKTGQLHELRNAYKQQVTEAQDDVGFRIARYEGE